jgi:hypothetical protein
MNNYSTNLTRATRCHIPEDGILHSHRREDLKPYNVKFRTVIGKIMEI